MERSNIFCVLLLLLTFQIGTSQTVSEENVSKKENKSEIKDAAKYRFKGIVLGVHGARETMFEIGYFKYTFDSMSGKSYTGSGYSISTEHYIKNNYIIAPKIAVFGNTWGINLGIGALWYFDMEKRNSLRVRPEIGFGAHNYKITYALNMAITNKDMPNISKHMLSAVYFLNFNKDARKQKLKG